MNTAHTLGGNTSPRKPTEYLFGGSAEDLSQIELYKLTVKGFERKNVEKMLSISRIYSNKKILSNIVGKSVRTLQRQSGAAEHLNEQQSVVALQYAKALEHAINVFGSQELAEEWLSRPCIYLDGNVPLEMINNHVGYQAVEDYLDRVEAGVYQ